MNIIWYGHSNFFLEHEAGSLCIDPFFEGNPTAPGKADSITAADAVLITHDHGDHVGQAVDIVKRTGARLVGVFDTVNDLAATRGLPANKGLGMNIGGTVSVGDIRVKMVQAVHSSQTGAATGYIITFPGGPTVYHAGDTALFASMELFGKFHDIDLALLPVGGWFTMAPEEAAYACRLLGCKTVTPMHWGTFPILEQNTSNFAAALKKHAPDTTLLELKPGVAHSF